MFTEVKTPSIKHTLLDNQRSDLARVAGRRLRLQVKPRRRGKQNEMPTRLRPRCGFSLHGRLECS